MSQGVNLLVPNGDVDEEVTRINPLPTIGAEHSQVHEGNLYTHDGVHSAVASGGGILDHLLRVPAGIECHLVFNKLSSDTAPGSITMYEAPETSADGAAETIQNNNRGSTSTSSALLFLGPTVSAPGTFLEGDIITGSKQEGGSEQSVGYEWVLVEGDYLFRFVNDSTSDANPNFHLSYYEKAI